MECYKACLVAKSFSETYVIDYLETFTSMEKMNTVQIILAITMTREWQLHQLDVKNVLLNKNLEEVYMCMHLGYEKTEKYYKLRKALYSLKQSPRA